MQVPQETLVKRILTVLWRAVIVRKASVLVNLAWNPVTVADNAQVRVPFKVVLYLLLILPGL